MDCGGKSHISLNCKFKDASCYRCKIKGHIASVCKARKNVHCIRAETKEGLKKDNIFDIYKNSN